jgi:hypothetical protein
MTTDISVGVRWDPIAQHEVIEDYEFDYDGGNSSSRLFERSRIKALAGNLFFLAILLLSYCNEVIFCIHYLFAIAIAIYKCKIDKIKS